MIEPGKLAAQLVKYGYDAYIERGHLYYRNDEGGIIEVWSASMVEILVNRAKAVAHVLTPDERQDQGLGSTGDLTADIS